MDVLSILGVILGFSALLGGNFLEGGTLQTLFNGPAAIIVLGGTIGAAVLQTPQPHLKRALSLFPWAFSPPIPEYKKGVIKIVNWAKIARRDGLLGLENAATNEKDQFLKKGALLLVDGCEPEEIRHLLENDLIIIEQRDNDAVMFYESMGGYAPTIGIIGAVLGLIHVMQHLADPGELGPGIAVAFVATIYGVALANLFFIPVANKIRACIKEQSQYRNLMIDGLMEIADGENPKAIEVKLNGYVKS